MNFILRRNNYDTKMILKILKYYSVSRSTIINVSKAFQPYFSSFCLPKEICIIMVDIGAAVKLQFYLVH